jgi:L-2-hydroxyglutarate oxidase LhgO
VSPERPAGQATADRTDATADRTDAPADRADVAVIGAGIVGLATSLKLLERKPGLRVVQLEKEPTIGFHQTGHNSGVLHAGLYYQPGSLKARLCVEGKAEMEAYCQAHGIPIERIGKLVIALEEADLARLAAVKERALANHVPGLEEVDPERIRELEPHATGLRALWSPGTAITDFAAVTRAMSGDVEARGARIETGRAVTSIERRATELVIGTSRGSLVARRVIACAGLQADRVAALSGDDEGRPHIVPFRGDYYVLKPEARHLVRGLIYPVPDPALPFLGVHFTKRLDGSVLAGPNAVLAGAREGYGRFDLSPGDLRDTLGYAGFRTLARRFWRSGAGELWRDWSKRAFAADLRRLVPAISADHLDPGPSGVRAQAVAPDGTMVDDFQLGGSERVLHVFNAPSPAATSSLAIGRVLADEAVARFDL